jgi:hypothetical protein
MRESRTKFTVGITATLIASLLSHSALAQIGQRNAAGKIMGDALFDQPGQPAAQKLAPVDDPPTATPAAKLPISQLHVPEGFKLEVYASGIANARSMALGDKGTVFVGNRVLDKVYAIVIFTLLNSTKSGALTISKPTSTTRQNRF